MNLNQVKVDQLLKICAAIYETLLETGPVREGPLYAMLMSLLPGLTLENFRQLVDLLVASKQLVRGDNFLLTAVKS